RAPDGVGAAARVPPVQGRRRLRGRPAAARGRHRHHPRQRLPGRAAAGQDHRRPARLPRRRGGALEGVLPRPAGDRLPRHAVAGAVQPRLLAAGRPGHRQDRAGEAAGGGAGELGVTRNTLPPPVFTRTPFMTSRLFAAAAFVALAGLAVADAPKGGKTMSVKKSDFGKTPDGQSVDLYTLTNANGMTV